MSCAVKDDDQSRCTASEAGARGEASIDTVSVLDELARAWPSPLATRQRVAFEAICRKLAVARTLHARYDEQWRPAEDRTPLSAREWPLAASTLLAWSQLPGAAQQDDRALAFKSLNAALTALDCCPNVPESLREFADSQLERISITSPPAQADPDRAPVRTLSAALSPRTLPLTVLAYEGPCVRAYLSTLRRVGLRPERIILLVLSEHPASRKPVGRWFPGRMRSWYAEKTQEQALNHWPRRIRAGHPELFRAILRGLEGMIEQPAATIDEMYGRFDYEAYADRVDRVVVRGLRDPALPKQLASGGSRTILFTGGGILPADAINVPGLRFLHVHPGHLPHVRGADGLLWSTLVRGLPAMSAFYLAIGLDTGDLVSVREYPPLRFETGATVAADDQTLYRAIFSFVDPLLRADTLVSALASAGGDPRRLVAAPQDANVGTTFHFMHPRLRARVLAHLFRRA